VKGKVEVKDAVAAAGGSKQYADVVENLVPNVEPNCIRLEIV